MQATASQTRRRADRIGLLAASGAVLAACAVPLFKWIGHGAEMSPGLGHSAFADRPLIVGAFIPYLAALGLLRRCPVRTRLVFGVASAACALLLLVPTSGSHDVFSYVFYGRMVTHGHLNPLVASPMHMSADPWFRWVDWKHTPSVYGPVWTYVCAGIAFIAGSRLLLAVALAKLLSIAGVMAAGFLIGGLREKGDREASWHVAALLWNPLVLFSAAGTGHVDGVLLGLVVAALYARWHESMELSTAALVVATLIKPYCAIFLLMHVLELAMHRGRRTAMLHTAVASTAVAAAYAPLWAGRATFSGVFDIGTRFTMTIPGAVRELLLDLVFPHTEGTAHAVSVSTWLVHLGSVAALGVVLAMLVPTLRDPDNDGSRWAVAFIAYLLVTPWFLPWHAIPLLGIVLSQERWRRAETALSVAALAFSLTALSSILLVRFALPFVSAGAVILLRRSRVPQPGLSA